MNKLVRVLGGGWYGCHIATTLLLAGHEVELHESATHLFAGASGSNPARLHLGFHYPRSRMTRAACQEQFSEFMASYGDLTAHIPENIYAIAEDDSQVDFSNYVQTLKGELECITVFDPLEWGLKGIEGALLTGERHIIISRARSFFEKALEGSAKYSVRPEEYREADFDLTVDCTFCALDGKNIDRYEPCITAVMRGPTERALTVMDGPFPSIYPWDEEKGLLSLTSARFTPLARCDTHEEARAVLRDSPVNVIEDHVEWMRDSLAEFWPASRDMFEPVDTLLSVRAMPKSAAAARLVDVVKTGDRTIRIRAGKIISIFHAERLVKETLCSL